MSQSASISPERVERFWDKFVKITLEQDVKGYARRWYVTRAQDYLEAFPDKRLAEHSARDVADYLTGLSTKDRILDWQFRQAVHAIQILFGLVKPVWFESFDWDYWFNAAGSLPPDHPTIARDSTATAGKQPVNDDGIESSLRSVREAHPRLFESMVAEIRRRSYSIRTEKAYVSWIARYIGFAGNQDPQGLSEGTIVSFLQHLAVEGNVSASTQNQALNAIVFLYRQVLKRPLQNFDEFVRAKRPKRLPVVLTQKEVTLLLEGMAGMHYLMAALLYGTGMRLMECVRLRVQDIDFDYNQIVVRDGKGQKDRVVPLPQTLREALREQLSLARRFHEQDLESGHGEVYLPYALARKYPNAATEWIWKYVFPSSRLSVDPRSGKVRRHHTHENGLQRSIKKAALAAATTKKVNCHALRHSFATHLLASGYDIRTVQELLGHANVATTMIYTHVLNRGGKGVASPLDTI